MSNSNAQSSVPKRRYSLGKRAAKREETRQRIVEAAVELHGTLGPAGTTVSQIADRAGVQRHTYYAHFPTEWDLVLACSGMSLERDPLPDLADLQGHEPGRSRIEAGLANFYAWFERNQEMAACVLRDAEHHALTRDIVQLRMVPAFAAAAELLGKDLSAAQRALLSVALEFSCWRTLRRSCSSPEAAAIMSAAIACLKE